MTTNEFYDLVAEMRKKQKEYFRHKDANVLFESKDLEKRVDNALDEHEQEKMGKSLF